MTIFGVILMIAGAVSAIYGINVNSNIEAQWRSVLENGQANPGTTYIIIGAIAFVIGLGLLIYSIVKKQKQ